MVFPEATVNFKVGQAIMDLKMVSLLAASDLKVVSLLATSDLKVVSPPATFDLKHVFLARRTQKGMQYYVTSTLIFHHGKS